MKKSHLLRIAQSFVKSNSQLSVPPRAESTALGALLLYLFQFVKKNKLVMVDGAISSNKKNVFSCKENRAWRTYIKYIHLRKVTLSSLRLFPQINHNNLYSKWIIEDTRLSITRHGSCVCVCFKSIFCKMYLKYIHKPNALFFAHFFACFPDCAMHTLRFPQKSVHRIHTFVCLNTFSFQWNTVLFLSQIIPFSYLESYLWLKKYNLSWKKWRMKIRPKIEAKKMKYVKKTTNQVS